MKKLYLFLLSILSLSTLHAQTITNIRATQEGKDILLTYDLRAEDNSLQFTTQLYFSTDGGRTFSGPLQQVSGEVGSGIPAGLNKRIRWKVLEEREQLQGDNIQFKVTATYTDLRFFEPEMVFVEGGTFWMGSDDSEAYSSEKPVHKVKLSDFSIGKYEVTNAQFCAFLNEMGNQKEGGTEWINLEGDWSHGKSRISKIVNRFEVEPNYEDHPVIYVSWYGAMAFCNWLKEKTGKNYQLPTEAQWEFAARGGNKSRGYKYAGSNDLDAVGWYSDNSEGGTHQIGQKRPNELGIYDMSGNVWEICQDWHGDYSKRAQKNPVGPSSGTFRVSRGGGWGDGARVSHREMRFPDGDSFSGGFRVALQ